MTSAALLALAGCGYQQTGVYEKNINSGYQWHSLYREDIQTVAVPVFLNRTYVRGLEMTLSKSIIEDIEAHTPYKVVSPQRADTILEGEIIFAGFTPLSMDPNTNLPQEQLYIVSVNFTWKNLRTGQILTQRRAFDQKTSYYPSLGEGQSTGSQDALEKLALGIVQELQADW